MKFTRRNCMALADLICGNLGADAPGPDQQPRYFPYRSSYYITQFFADMDTDWAHDGPPTRNWWVADVIEAMLNEPHGGPAHPPRSSAGSSTT